ncbi:thioesterase II family protein [Amycolatopsis regifaucium]|uniref:Thioesterase n=1 Tax=Amycolatopsis regifaucium TaxID=546365 RepID=A0A154MPS3_9PSEU|nr:alpha/beta fold hydrolase [Amycolatopsis regifaucium]KZB86302.1 thioesterase [Amycolatopsis regifaucium]OKA05192.1 thioesterase [Amycolatopsis regifaucium]SFH76085.1 Surfactin synthase thioesterase subunit [Amycolatopsis regifaucium]
MPTALIPLSTADSRGARYLLLPPAGGTLRAFGPLAGQARADVWGVEYPGHGDQLAEAPATSLEDLGAQLAQEVTRDWFSRTVVIGFGMGAFVALETAQRLGVAPGAFIVADACAPQRRSPDMHAKTAASAMGRVFGRTGLTPVAGYRDAPERWEYALDLLLGDLQLLNAYRGPARTRLSCPIAAMRGIDDPAFASGDDATGGWRVWTSGPFVGRVVPGGHLGVLETGREAEFWARIHRLEAAFLDVEPEVA